MIRNTFIKIFVAFSLLFGPSQLFAQEVLRFDDFLQKSIEEVDKVLGERAERRTFKAFPIEDIQIRTETDRLDFNRQEYLLRVRPTSFKLENAQSSFYNILQDQMNYERQALKADFIENAYQDWLAIYFASKKLEIHEQQLILLEDEEKVLQKLSQLPGSSVKDLIDIQKDIFDLKIDIHKKEQFLKKTLTSDKEIDANGMVTVERIKERLNAKEISGVSANLLQETVFDLQLVDAEINMEEADRKRYLDYVQVKYSGPHDDFFREKVAIGVGFQIPFSNSGKLKLEELDIKKKITQNEFQVKMKLEEDQIEKQQQEIELLLEEWEFSKKLYEDIKIQSEGLIQKAIRKEGATPLLMLKNKKDLVKYDLDLLEVEEAIYEEYVNLLILTGKLFEEPFENYLAK